MWSCYNGDPFAVTERRGLLGARRYPLERAAEEVKCTPWMLDRLVTTGAVPCIRLTPQNYQILHEDLDPCHIVSRANWVRRKLIETLKPEPLNGSGRTLTVAGKRR